MVSDYRWLTMNHCINLQGVVTTMCPVLPAATAIKNFDPASK